MAESSPTEYTLEEVAQHNTAEDCWLALHGKVYNVTEFLQDHPGGEEIIVEQGGREATDEFEDIGHSQSARDLLPKYEIGVCPEKDPEQERKIKAQIEFTDSKRDNGGNSMLRLALPLVVLLIAILYAFTRTSPGEKVN